MPFEREVVIIYTIGKRGPFPNTLTKSLAGLPLIQRAINLALEISLKSQIFVVSDTEEIDLISERNGVSSLKRQNLFDLFDRFESENIVVSIRHFVLFN